MNVTQQRLVALLAVCIGGYIVISVATPMKPRQEYAVKTLLESTYKTCLVLISKGEENPNLDLTDLQQNNSLGPRNLDWEIVDMKSRTQLDPDQNCSKAHLLAVTTKNEKFWKQLAYGLNLQNGQKSCVSREGDNRDNWSCK